MDQVNEKGTDSKYNTNMSQGKWVKSESFQDKGIDITDTNADDEKFEDPIL